ncbi:meiosis-specific protein MEI4 isoform X2 [Poecilia reticulata]|nr:PREDICTED: meiosis-specific protein MEI4-like isoform X2 [Poecilia reticulata]XP_008395235.1 PREDICTED: meiosis-specific protein MEI4-like isoform X2 [Poecilia reticulata]XP_008395237.1 PREDICTED: meiosis-specific protein MEI4-like isoform X2 [Poecilia reticulata]XP_017157639.1 PREDICTED: meiosis-specific protein MEI4-like isoform X2 [Poecilia reticulata]XP_017157640.1 PREDICTED: meiosis-specific protein MEI4-like isoform X2 [Poecilia reticulata]
MKAQVAVAMAVIRSRPPGVSSRQHSEALGRTLRRQDGAWRERAQALQQEVLRLQQELLVSRATDNTNRSWETADGAIMEDLSQDLFGPGSPAFSADPPPDRDSETPDLLLHSPPPLPPPPSRLQSDPWSDALLPHMRFLQSLCSLQRLDGSSAALAPEGHGDSAASETVFLLLDSVAAACRAPPPPGLPDLLPQACRVASRALDLLCSGRPSADLRRRLEEALRELTRTLLHSQRPGRAAEKLKESLVALGSSSVSKSFLVCLILSEIGSLAEQLWQTSQVQESSALRTFPLDRYQNSCHLLWVLERLLPGPDPARRRPELEAAQTAFLHRLELLVFLLWDEFPLFSVLMWRIGKLLV